MSRIGKQPIEVPSGVQIRIETSRAVVEGPKGKLETPLPQGIVAEVSDQQLVVRREKDTKQLKALHGLTRALLANAVSGVTQGFKKELDVVGIGYRAEVRGKYVSLSLGHSHPVDFPIPAGIEVRIDRAQKALNNYVATIVVSGASKHQVGQVAADIRAVRPPDAYKGKGVRYAGEVVRIKVGKKGA